MITKDNTYAVVVWFNPSEEQCRNIESYINLVKGVIIVDNSTADNSSLLSGYSHLNLTYLPLYDNLGIASALNRGCQYAIDYGAEWIMTMDQDSCWDNEQLSIYLRLANKYEDSNKVGVFSPRQKYTNHLRHYENEYEEKTAVMTSGCLISKSGFIVTRGFLEDLFIDEVDNEYCMHIHRAGLKVIIINNVFLNHHLGERRMIRFLGLWQKEYTGHQPFRYYYMTRNNLFLNRLYPEYKSFNRKRLNKMLKRILLYENVHKLESIRFCWKGWLDYKNNRFGRLD